MTKLLKVKKIWIEFFNGQQNEDINEFIRRNKAAAN